MSHLKASIRRLQSLLRRRGQRREDAEDLVQEAFVRLQAYCEAGNEVRSTDAFLVRTALNLAANARRLDRSHLFVREPVEDLELLDLAPMPDEVFAAEECLKGMDTLLKGLGRRTREVFYMHRLHGMSYLQIADHFDISVSAIEKHIASAMAVLGPAMHRELKKR